MRIEDLPVAAVPYPDESIYSWLDATREMLKLGSSDWRQWCRFSVEEPERRLAGTNWGAVPPELGRVDRIPVSWRVGPEWRGMKCPLCSIAVPGGHRYPVVVDWLDVRAIACCKHRLLLTYQPTEGAMPVDTNEEIFALWGWLEMWRHSCLERWDAKLRRDLVLAAGRNWGPQFGSIASAEVAWSIEGAGWKLPNPQRQYRPLGPARTGSLGPMDRAAALLGAFRAWRALTDPSSPTLPTWPGPAWMWLARRWNAYGDGRIGAMFAGIVLASCGRVRS